jgi:hypothetical protein
MRELGTIMQYADTTLDDAWLENKLREAGYKEEDISKLVAALHCRAEKPYQDRLMAAVVKRYRLGLGTEGILFAVLNSFNLPPDISALANDALRTEIDNEYTATEIDLAVLAYTRNETTDEEFGEALRRLDLDQDYIDWRVAVERLKRMHKVWILTDTEKARACLDWYRKSFLYGLLKLSDYVMDMHMAGLDDDMILARLKPDQYERDKNVAAELRQWKLPAARDLAIEGDWTVEHYRTYLLGLNFPDRWLEAEVNLVGALAYRAKQSRIERYQIHTYEQGYVLSLFAEPALRRLYQEAGRRTEEIEARMRLLTTLRMRTKRPSNAELIAAAEWDYLDWVIDDDALLAVYQKYGVAPDRAQARLKVLATMRL